MFSILPHVIARLKALLLPFVVAELEADLIAAAAERKAELLRQANQYEQHDLPTVAEQLRRQAEALAPDKPLASVAAAIAHLQTDPTPGKAADAPLSASGPQSAESPPPSSQKKKS